MKLITWIALSLGTLMAGPVPDFPFISASGQAEESVAPDQAYVRFTVMVSDAKSEVAAAKLEGILKTIVADVISLGVQKEDIIADDLSKDVVRRKVEKYKKLEIIGYNLSRNVSLVVRDLKQYAPVAKKVFATDGVIHVYSNFEYSKKDELRLNMLTKACAKARQKGERLAEAAGVKIRNVHAVSDHGLGNLTMKYGINDEANFFPLSADSGGLLPSGSDKRPEPTLLVPKKISMAVDVNMLFRLAE